MKYIRKLISLLSNHDMTRLQITIIFAGISVALLGFLALIGLALNKTWLASLGSGLIPMAPSTALFFILLGISITVNAKNYFIKKLYVSTIIAIFTLVVLSFIIFILSLFNIHIPFEPLGFSVSGSVGGAPTGYMSPITALCFIFSGTSFLLTFIHTSYNVWRSIASFYLSGMVLLISFLFLEAYIFGAPLLYGSTFIPPALNTIIAFILLGIIGSFLTGKYIYENNIRLKATVFPFYILLIILIFFIIAIFTTGFSYYRNYEKQYRATIEKQLSAVADLKVEQLVQWRKERLGDAAVFYRNSVFSGLIQQLLENPNNAYTKNKLSSWLTPVLSAYEYNRICFHDVSGNELFSIPEDKIHTPAVFKRRISEVLKTGTIAFQDFYRDEYDQKVYLNIFIPVFDEFNTNKILGVLALRIDPSLYLYSFIETWPTQSDTAETLLVRREENEAVFLNELRFQKNTALNLKIPLSRKEVPAVRAALGYEGIFDGIDYRGERVISYIRTIPDSPWHFVARMDTSEMYAPLRDRLHLILFLTFALLAGTAASVGLVWRQQRIRFYKTQLFAEKKLNWLQNVIARSLNEIYVYDPVSLKFKFVNAGAQNNLGYSMQELSDISILDIKPEYSDETYRKLIQPLISGNEDIVIFETIHKRKDGTIYPVEVHLQCVETDDGNVLLAIINDITERNLTKENLRKTNEYLENLFNYANAPIITWDTNRKINRFNHAFERLTGYSAAEVVGRDLQMLFPSENREESLRMIAQTSSGELWESVEIPIMRKDDDIRIALWNSANIYSQDGSTLVATIAQGQDITERKRIEDELRISEEKFINVFEHAPIGKSLTAIDGTVNINQTFCSMIGYSLEELKGLKWQEITYPEDIEMTQDNMNSLIKGERKIARFQKRYIHKNGSVIWTDVSSYLQLDKAGNPLYFITAINDITERKLTEKALQESTRKIKEAQELAHLGYWLWDIKTGEVEWSEEVYKIFNLDPNEFKPNINSILELSPWPEDHERDKELISKAVENHTPGFYEQKFLRPDKSIGFYTSTFQGNYDEKGNLLSIVGTILDITDRKKAEADFIASETRYRRLFESAKDGILILDAESGMIVDVNPFLITMLGYTYEQFLGKYIWDIGIFKDIIANKNNLETLLEKEYIRYEDLPLQKADDTIINVEFVSNVYLVNNQKVIQCNIRDISERIKTESELKIKNQVFEDSIAAQSTANLKGELTHANPAFLQMWGYEHLTEIIGKTVDALFANPADAIPVFEAMNTSGKWSGEFQALRADGSIFISRGYSTCMKNTRGEIIGYQSANLDVTKERETDALILQTSADLARSNRDLEQFANVASHDLQEPLRMVSSYTQLLADRYKDQLDEKAHKYITYAVDGAVRMQRLINDLLIYSRVGTRGKQPEPVDAHKILGEALANLSSAIQDSHAVITNDNLPVVFVDATQLLQVFQNLISNAVKFCSGRSPYIHIGVRDSGHEWIFSVKDNGIGIDSRYAERLFIIFQRLHTRDEYQGTGIGLALCKRIIDRHGGNIWFESEPGEGSTFYFTLKKIKEVL
jgi:PAS domain S-box-containing protein